MTPFTCKPYNADTDLQTIIDLLSQRLPTRVTDYPSIVDMYEILGVSEPEETIAIWETVAGKPIGFSMLDGNSLRFDLVPEAAHSDLAAQMIDWATMQLQSEITSDNQPMRLRTSCVDDNAQRLAILNQHAFIQEEGHTLYFQRSLQEPIPEPSLPAGFTIRPMASEGDVEAHVALHRAAFGTKHMTVDYRLSMMRVPDYDPELDLIAIAPDGTFAAYAMANFQPAENVLSGRNEGYTDPVATHPKYQRLGLARALILRGCQLLQQRGMETARLGTWYENIAMQRVAESAGFAVKSKALFFEKVVSA